MLGSNLKKLKVLWFSKKFGILIKESVYSRNTKYCVEGILSTSKVLWWNDFTFFFTNGSCKNKVTRGDGLRVSYNLATHDKRPAPSWLWGYFRMRNFMQPYKRKKTQKSVGLFWKFPEHSRMVICHYFWQI